MPERSFDDGFWSDPFVQDLPKDAKLLYAYSFTNRHCNQAGLYQITVKTMAFETGLDQEIIPDLLERLQEKVAWYPDHQLLWVKNFLKRQTRSPKFLIAASRCLSAIKEESIVQSLLSYNHTLAIPYPYPSDTIPISPTAYANAHAGTNALSDLSPNTLSPDFSEILIGVRSLPAWRTSPDDAKWLDDFKIEFPLFTLADIKACSDRWDGKHTANDKGDWKNRLRNWMKVESRKADERGGSPASLTRLDLKSDPEEYFRRYGHLAKKPDGGGTE